MDNIYNSYNSKGLALYLTLMIMTILLTMVFGLSGILISRMRIIKGMEYSVIAFYAADTGIEETLMNLVNPVSSCSCTEPWPCVLDNGAKYCVTVTNPAGICQGDGSCVLRAFGTYGAAGTSKKTRRAVEINY